MNPRCNLKRDMLPLNAVSPMIRDRFFETFEYEPPLGAVPQVSIPVSLIVIGQSFK